MTHNKAKFASMFKTSFFFFPPGPGELNSCLARVQGKRKPERKEEGGGKEEATTRKPVSPSLPLLTSHVDMLYIQGSPHSILIFDYLKHFKKIFDINTSFCNGYDRNFLDHNFNPYALNVTVTPPSLKKLCQHKIGELTKFNFLHLAKKLKKEHNIGNSSQLFSNLICEKNVFFEEIYCNIKLKTTDPVLSKNYNDIFMNYEYFQSKLHDKMYNFGSIPGQILFTWGGKIPNSEKVSFARMYIRQGNCITKKIL